MRERAVYRNPPIMMHQRPGRVLNNGVMFLHGAVSVMIGTTLPEMIRAFNLSYAEGGLLVSLNSAGGLLIMFLGMLFADRIRKPVMIIASVALAGALFAATGLAPAYWFLMAVFFTTGIVVQFMDMLLNAFTGDIAKSNRTRALNILHMLYSIGAFIGPTFARWLLNRDLSWSGVYFVVGGVYLAAAALSLIWIRQLLEIASETTSGNSAPGKPAPRPVSPAPARGWVGVTLAGGVLLFYAIHQLSTTAWLPTYVETVLGTSPNLASAALSFYWIGIIVSRLFASAVARRVGEARVLIWGSFVGGAILVAVVAFGSPAVAILGFVATGVLTGATIPLGMSMAYGFVPLRTGAVTSLVYGLMAVGRLIGPWIVGSLGDRLGLRPGILFAAAVLLLSGLFSVGVAVSSRHNQPN